MRGAHDDNIILRAALPVRSAAAWRARCRDAINMRALLLIFASARHLLINIYGGAMMPQHARCRYACRHVAFAHDARMPPMLRSLMRYALITLRAIRAPLFI